MPQLRTLTGLNETGAISQAISFPYRLGITKATTVGCSSEHVTALTPYPYYIKKLYCSIIYIHSSSWIFINHKKNLNS